MCTSGIKMPSLFISLWSAKYPLGSWEAGGPPGHCTWLLRCVWVQETPTTSGVCGMFQRGLPQAFPGVVTHTFPEGSPRFSPSACDESYIPGVHVLVDMAAAVESFCFSLEQKFVINIPMKTESILLDIPFLIALVQQPFQRKKCLPSCLGFPEIWGI